MATTTVDNVKRNGFYRLFGDSKKEAYQVMELWPKVMTVKCSNGCMTKPYDQFVLVEDTLGYTVHKWEHEVEDNRGGTIGHTPVTRLFD